MKHLSFESFNSSADLTATHSRILAAIAISSSQRIFFYPVIDKLLLIVFSFCIFLAMPECSCMWPRCCNFSHWYRWFSLFSTVVRIIVSLGHSTFIFLTSQHQWTFCLTDVNSVAEQLHIWTTTYICSTYLCNILAVLIYSFKCNMVYS